MKYNYYPARRYHLHKIHGNLHITMYEAQDVQTCYQSELEQNQYAHHKLYNGVFEIAQMKCLKKLNIYFITNSSYN